MSDDLHLRDLRYFVACCDCSGMSRAAERLHVAQPTLSHALHRLEQQSGHALLIRGRGKELRPTPMGEVVLEQARRLLNLSDELSERLHHSGSAEITGTLRLGSIQSLNLTLLPPVLARFAATHPQVTLRLETLQGTEMARALHRDEIDLAVVAGAPASALAGLSTHQLLRERFVAIVRRDDPLAARGSVALRELASRELALVPADSFTGRVIEEACAAAGFAPQRRLALASGEALRETVRAGLGITILPLGYLSPSDPDLRPVELTDPTPRRSVLLLERPDSHRSRAAVAFSELLTTHSHSLQGTR
ncbi:MAG: LysR family transcriptional regulator [Planctomycetota bacterium]|jgi:DNA-binding transcriptional LysR family regulator|nr:LysR family transcriptional regulator [Planctomycetota bacterium]